MLNMKKSPSCVFLSFSLHCFISSSAWIDMNITIDKSALLSLKSLTTSDPYDSLSTWSLSSSPCNWVGVTCNTHHGRIRSLNLGGMDLKGTISPQLGNISFLVELDLSSNSFYGQIPRELVRLRRLKLLNLSYNDFHGQVPALIGDLSILEYLNIRNNSFDGFIPLSLFNLSRLEVFDWSFNKLSGIIPQTISNLSLLELLNMSHNTLAFLSLIVTDLKLLFSHHYRAFPPHLRVVSSLPAVCHSISSAVRPFLLSGITESLLCFFAAMC
ncbi:putative leucine-rich repeat receptor-like serine/threonine-protein kinase At2g24130 [Prosopis cineraria]|uniref:putative leucine-rich repeat receptor-like serine/threonine-protein kinase At2g24130 n=1 Tax=Prosopis cineraria TaxID=364024 RepID=UPI00240F910A|nr:putative leucine-rich repeat receptor-like serine/threonine-protein kinase At2g24130 [Prosopis cineraria]